MTDDACGREATLAYGYAQLHRLLSRSLPPYLGAPGSRFCKCSWRSTSQRASRCRRQHARPSSNCRGCPLVLRVTHAAFQSGPHAACIRLEQIPRLPSPRAASCEASPTGCRLRQHPSILNFRRSPPAASLSLLDPGASRALVWLGTGSTYRYHTAHRPTMCQATATRISSGSVEQDASAPRIARATSDWLANNECSETFDVHACVACLSQVVKGIIEVVKSVPQGHTQQ